MNRQKNPLTVNQFNEYFAIDRDQRKDLKNILKTLVRKGSIVKLKGHMFSIANEPDACHRNTLVHKKREWICHP